MKVFRVILLVMIPVIVLIVMLIGHFQTEGTLDIQNVHQSGLQPIQQQNEGEGSSDTTEIPSVPEIISTDGDSSSNSVPPVNSPSSQPQTEEATLIQVPPMPPGCSVFRKNLAVDALSPNIRSAPSIEAEVIATMQPRWYPVVGAPQQGPDGNSTNDDDLWYPIRLEDGRTGYVAAWIVRLSQDDCAPPPLECSADILHDIENKLTSNIPILIGQDCIRLDIILNQNPPSDMIQRFMPDLDEFEECENGGLNFITMLDYQAESIENMGAPVNMLGEDRCSFSHMPTPTPSDTLTPTPSGTLTPTPSGTPTLIPCGTLTVMPGDMLTPTPGSTLIPLPCNTLTPTPSNTQTLISTAITIVPTLPTVATISLPTNGGSQPTPTDTPLPTPSPTNTFVPTPTSTPTPTATLLPKIGEAQGVYLATDADGNGFGLFLLYNGERIEIKIPNTQNLQGTFAYPALSPDGRSIAFLWDTEPDDPTKGGKVRVIFLGENFTFADDLTVSPHNLNAQMYQLAWMPQIDSTNNIDTYTLLFSASAEGERGTTNIYWVSFSRHLGRQDYDLFAENASDPAWSPDGLMIAFVREGRVYFTKTMPSSLKGLQGTELENSLSPVEMSVVNQSDCDRMSEPAFGSSDEYPLFYVCTKNAVDTLHIYAKLVQSDGVKRDVSQRLDFEGLQGRNLNHPAPLVGWYLTFDDGEKLYLAEIEPDSTGVIKTITLLVDENMNIQSVSWSGKLT